MFSVPSVIQTVQAVQAKKRKNKKSRHIPYPDWIQNVTVTCKKSHKYNINSFGFRQYIGICRKHRDQKVAPTAEGLILKLQDIDN